MRTFYNTVSIVLARKAINVTVPAEYIAKAMIKVHNLNKFITISKNRPKVVKTTKFFSSDSK